ncbi:MAG TPA: tetratricopeptide repeat protein [Vicinamibacterales bacterium]
MSIDRDATLKIADEFLRDGREDDAAACIELAVDELIIAGSFGDAATLLQDFLVRVPGRIPTLLRFIEVCLDGGFEALMFDGQAMLADAYLVAGRAAEALVIAEDLVAREPAREEHHIRLARAREALDRANVAAAPPKPRQDPVEIDLNVVLNEIETQMAAAQRRPRDLEDVFTDIRSEVAGDEDADTSADHLALARTFIEMGMTREASSSLEIAARSPRHRFAAAWLLGGIHRQQGQIPDAIEWFERAAQAPPTSPEDGRGLLYDLGDVLEAAGEKARALAVFLELRAEAPDYRDVSERVSRLSGAETEG